MQLKSGGQKSREQALSILDELQRDIVQGDSVWDLDWDKKAGTKTIAVRVRTPAEAPASPSSPPAPQKPEEGSK